MKELSIFTTPIIKLPSLLFWYQVPSSSQIEFSYVFWTFSGFILSLWDHVFDLQAARVFAFVLKYYVSPADKFMAF